MSKTGKRKRQANQAPERADAGGSVYNKGLYSGLAHPESAAAGGLFARLNFSVYIPALMSIWVFCYLMLSMGILPSAHVPLTGLALVLSLLALAGAFMLFRPRPGLGPWPADRMAAMTLALMIVDFWVWVWNRPFTGLTEHIFVLVDIAGFTVLLFCVYMFVYRRLHIEAVFKLLGVKAFFDFAAYALSGGFGIEILGRMGITHPLHIDALFTVAMLELWALLVYILKYRNKINALPA